MSNYSNGEVFGAKILNAVIILGAAALLLAAITSPAPKARIAQVYAPLQVAEQVVVIGHQG
jgi:hypothetical protein